MSKQFLGVRLHDAARRSSLVFDGFPLRTKRAPASPDGSNRCILAALLVLSMLGCVEVGPDDDAQEIDTPDDFAPPEQPEEAPRQTQPQTASPDLPPLPFAATLTEQTTGAEGDLTDADRIVTTEDGQTIEQLDVTTRPDTNAAIVVRHDDVTIRNVHVTAPGPAAGIRIEDGSSGTLVEHVTIDGEKSEYGTGRDDANWGNEGIIAYSPFTARRNHIFDVRQGIQIWSEATGSTVTENYISGIWPNADGVSTTGISYRGNSGNKELTTIARNRITVSGFGGISVSARSGPVHNLDIIDNLIRGSISEHEDDMITGYGIRGGYQGKHRDENQNIRIEGNQFDGIFLWGTNGAVNVEQPGNTFDDNRWVRALSEVSPEKSL